MENMKNMTKAQKKAYYAKMSPAERKAYYKDMGENYDPDLAQELAEFQATGDPSYVSEPVTPVGRTAKLRRGDKTAGEKNLIKQGNSETRVAVGKEDHGGLEVDGETKLVKQGDSGSTVHTSKAKIVAKVMKELNDLSGDDLEDVANRIFATIEEDENELDMNNVKVRQIAKITTDDLDLDESLGAMFGDGDLSEEFKKRITTVFEAAVVNVVNEQLENMAIDYDSDFELQTESTTNDMIEKMDSYLSYVVEQWIENNKLAVESGIKGEIAETFLTGMRDLFLECHVDIPEESVDIVEELVAQNEQLTADLTEQLDKSVTLNEEVQSFQRREIFEDVGAKLTDTEQEKLVSLAEGIDYTDVDDYRQKVVTLAESYFTSTKTVTSKRDPFEDDLNVLEEETQIPVNMRAYTSAISRTALKS